MVWQASEHANTVRLEKRTVNLVMVVGYSGDSVGVKKVEAIISITSHPSSSALFSSVDRFRWIPGEHNTSQAYVRTDGMLLNKK